MGEEDVCFFVCLFFVCLFACSFVCLFVIVVVAVVVVNLFTLPNHAVVAMTVRSSSV